MHDQPGEIVSPHESVEMEELQAVLRIKDQLIESLTFERDGLEKRFKEIGQKYLDLLSRHEALRHEMERMPSLEELVKMQTKIMSLEQKLKQCRRQACAQPVCDSRSAVDDAHRIDTSDKA
jgi:uncharacterized coiled-coil DUF342 family protein